MKTFFKHCTQQQTTADRAFRRIPPSKWSNQSLAEERKQQLADTYLVPLCTSRNVWTADVPLLANTNNLLLKQAVHNRTAADYGLTASPTPAGHKHQLQLDIRYNNHRFGLTFSKQKGGSLGRSIL